MTRLKEHIECDACGKLIDPYKDTHYVSTSEDVLCEECGDDVLSIHEYTQYDDYPYIDESSGDWDGPRYISAQWRRI